MNRLRKILAWLWRTKERIVLATMVAILCHRVYKVIYPDVEEGPNQIVARPPSNEPPEGTGPPLPPPPPPPPRELVISSLWNRNMFQYRPGGGQGGGGAEGDLPDVKLIRLSPGPRAQIETTARRWYSEGDKFETYTLLAIDPEGCDGEGSVKIYDESRRDTFDICKE